jgi:ELWxxDGT repeat protein
MRSSHFNCSTRLSFTATALALAVAAVPPLHAQTPFLVDDIDTTGEPYFDECLPGPCPPPSNPQFGGLPRQLTPWGDLLAFVANDREHGFEPWISDGTPGGTRLLADLVAGEGGGGTVILGEVGEDLLFWGATVGLGPCGLWRADRETLTAELLGLGPEHPLGSGRIDSCQVQPIGPGVAFEGSLFFEVRLPPPGASTVLARSGGTAEGTEIVLEICGPHQPCYSTRSRLGVLRRQLYAGTSNGLWVIGPRIGEPGLLADLPCVGEITPIPSVVQELFFVSGCGERTLHHLVPDPAGPAGTEPLRTFERQPSGLFPEPTDLTVRGDGVDFVLFLFDTDDRAEIWTSDGTPAGTRPVATGFQRSAFAFPDLAVVGDRLVFGATPQDGSQRFLFSLGPNDELVRLLDEPAWLEAVISTGSWAFLGLQTAEHGFEPWRTDGTPEGTVLLAELEPGPSSSGPLEPTRVGDLVFFSAQTEELGRELWAIRLSELPPTPPPPPPSEEWVESPAFPDFRFQVRISHGSGSAIPGAEVLACQNDTVCVSGALPGRPEVYLRVLGPRPNGFLWPTIIRFTPSRVEVWVEQESTGQLNYYDLPAVGPGDEDLSGRQDRKGFLP